MAAPPPSRRPRPPIPVWVSEYHDEALRGLHLAIRKKQLRGSPHVTMIHFDSHPDLAAGNSKFPADLCRTELPCFDVYELYHALRTDDAGIASWILPSVFMGDLDHVVWVKQPFCTQIRPGTYRGRVGGARLGTGGASSEGGSTTEGGVHVAAGSISKPSAMVRPPAPARVSVDEEQGKDLHSCTQPHDEGIEVLKLDGDFARLAYYDRDTEVVYSTFPSSSSPADAKLSADAKSWRLDVVEELLPSPRLNAVASASDTAQSDEKDAPRAKKARKAPGGDQTQQDLTAAPEPRECEPPFQSDIDCLRQAIRDKHGREDLPQRLEDRLRAFEQSDLFFRRGSQTREEIKEHINELPNVLRANGSSSGVKENGRREWHLDIDLDYFATRNPFTIGLSDDLVQAIQSAIRSFEEDTGFEFNYDQFVEILEAEDRELLAYLLFQHRDPRQWMLVEPVNEKDQHDSAGQDKPPGLEIAGRKKPRDYEETEDGEQAGALAPCRLFEQQQLEPDGKSCGRSRRPPLRRPFTNDTVRRRVQGWARRKELIAGGNDPCFDVDENGNEYAVMDVGGVDIKDIIKSLELPEEECRAFDRIRGWQYHFRWRERPRWYDDEYQRWLQAEFEAETRKLLNVFDIGSREMAILADAKEMVMLPQNVPECYESHVRPKIAEMELFLLLQLHYDELRNRSVHRGSCITTNGVEQTGKQNTSNTSSDRASAKIMKNLLMYKPAPGSITIARSCADKFCPMKYLVQIEADVLQMLQRVYGEEPSSSGSSASPDESIDDPPSRGSRLHLQRGGGLEIIYADEVADY